jgi:hypothetical protein
MIHFDKKIWQRRSISNKHNTSWKCGVCGIGGLQLQSEIPKSNYYSLAIRCTDSNCTKQYRIVGSVVPEAKGVEVAENYFRIDNYRLYPTHFEPELVMFEMPISLNAEVKSKLIKSFNHFWYDLDACANMIRQGIELIVVEKGGVGETLHTKIASLRTKLGDKLTDAILALKWIGNDGSHPGRSFKRDEILDSYGVLVDVLNQMYPDESEKERRDSLVQLILDKKGIKSL